MSAADRKFIINTALTILFIATFLSIILSVDEHTVERVDKGTVVVTENSKPWPNFWNNTKTTDLYVKVSL